MSENSDHTSWVISSSLNLEHIEQYGRDILSNPSVTLSIGDKPQELYTKEQLLEMFQIGCMVMSKKEMKNAITITDNVPFYVLKNMEVGDFVFFPYESWNAARSAASLLKKTFGTRFRVNKTGALGKHGNIKVVRLT